MAANDLKIHDDELDAFGLIVYSWENKWVLLGVIATSMIIGFIYCYISNSSLPKSLGGSYSITSNFLLQDNQIFTGQETVRQINRRLSSAYNYEKWSEENKEFFSHLPQSLASSIKISDVTHTVSLNVGSEKNIAALTSYLTYTLKIIDKKINDELEKRSLNEIEIYEEKINNQKKIINIKKKEIHTIDKRREKLNQTFELKILDIDNEILNNTIQLRAAEEELDYISNNINDETKKTAQVILRTLDLTNTIKVNRLIIENLKLRKDGYSKLENTLDQEIIELAFEENAMEAELNMELKILDDLINTKNGYVLNKNNEIVKLGRTTSIYSPNQIKKMSLTTVLLISFVIGLISGISILLFKKEYNRRKHS